MGSGARDERAVQANKREVRVKLQQARTNGSVRSFKERNEQMSLGGGHPTPFIENPLLSHTYPHPHPHPHPP
eukprot:1149303-Pelagomonas_calceolata.AAC.4